MQYSISLGCYINLIGTYSIYSNYICKLLPEKKCFDGCRDYNYSYLFFHSEINYELIYSLQPTHVQLRDKKGKSMDRPISHTPLSEDSESPPPVQNKGFAESRRKSLPPAFLNEEMQRFQESRSKTVSYPFHSTRKPKYPTHSSQDSVEEYDPPHEMDRTSLNESLGPVYPKRGMSRNYSHGHALNQLRQDLKDKLHPPQSVQAAWRSNPGSQNPSRQGSRIASSTSTRNSLMQSGLEDLHDEDEPEIIFHPAKTQNLAKSQTLPRDFTVASKKLFSATSPEAEDGTHLPSLHPPLPSRGGRRHVTTDHLHKRQNGFRLNSGDAFSINSDCSIDEILTEIQRVASNIKMRERELNGNMLSCNWKGVRFSVSVQKQGSHCQLRFKWFSGGDLSTYKEICEKFMRRLKLT